MGAQQFLNTTISDAMIFRYNDFPMPRFLGNPQDGTGVAVELVHHTY